LKPGKLYRFKIPAGNFVDQFGEKCIIRRNEILLFLSQNRSKRFNDEFEFHFLYEEKILKGTLWMGTLWISLEEDKIKSLFEEIRI